MKKYFYLLMLSFLFLGCEKSPNNTIYFNGDIITMEEPLYAEALSVENGVITDIGSYDDIIKLKNKNTLLVDLQGKTLMPSFIDSHSHIMQFAQSLSSCDLNGAKDFTDIENMLKICMDKIGGGALAGFGYDHNFLVEKTHPTKAELDKVSKDYPIVIAHASGHAGVMNSKALELAGIDKNTPDISGGVIERDNKGEPTGYLEENAFIDFAPKVAATPDEIVMERLMENAQDIYLSYGITTAQEALVGDKEFAVLKNMSDKNKLKIDVIGFIDMKNAARLYENNDYINKYKNRFKIGGYKIFLDGSPQAKTAWLTCPYLNSGDYRGYPIYKDDEVEKFIVKAVKDKMQLQAHCNGDAASDQYINIFKKVIEDNGFSDIYRPVMIHSQTARKDQYDNMSKMGMLASIFVAHVYYWGDVHLINLGWDRASNISASRFALDSGINFTYHQDTPVIKPNMLESVWVAVNRLTRDGVLLGDYQRSEALNALKGVTVNAAFQNGEEGVKGVLKKGMKADMVILSANPLKANDMEIKDIEVLETIKDGVSVYKKENAASDSKD